MGTLLRHVLLLQKDIGRAARFYSEGLELPIIVLTDRWAELGAGPSRIALKAVEGCCPAHDTLKHNDSLLVTQWSYCRMSVKCAGRRMPAVGTRLSSALR